MSDALKCDACGKVAVGKWERQGWISVDTKHACSWTCVRDLADAEVAKRTMTAAELAEIVAEPVKERVGWTA